MGVQIEVPAALARRLGAAGNQVPQPQTGQALIDTGASVTCVHEPTLTNLGVQPVGSATIGTAGGEHQRGLYPTRILLPQANIDAEYASVVSVDLSGQGIIALLGRDFLERVLMVYDGPSGEIILGY